MSDLRDGARADHRNAKRLAHRPVLACPSPIPAQRYITPVRSQTVDSPLHSTPPASTLNPHRLPPISPPPGRDAAVVEAQAARERAPNVVAPERAEIELERAGLQVLVGELLEQALGRERPGAEEPRGAEGEQATDTRAAVTGRFSTGGQRRAPGNKW